MEQKEMLKEIASRMKNCLEQLSDARGVERCALIYAMAQLIDTMNETISAEDVPAPAVPINAQQAEIEDRNGGGNGEDHE